MTTLTRRRLPGAGAVALLAVAGLAGCTATNDLFHGTATTHVNSRGEMHGGAPSWVPKDASDIHIVSGSKGETASVLLASTDDLDPACVEVPRRSAPTVEVEGAPNVYDVRVKTVFSCGNWTVMATPDGWYGWTPATEDEATPTTTPTS